MVVRQLGDLGADMETCRCASKWQTASIWVPKQSRNR
jgi:hypothetical protein